MTFFFFTHIFFFCREEGELLCGHFFDIYLTSIDFVVIDTKKQKQKQKQKFVFFFKVASKLCVFPVEEETPTGKMNTRPASS